KTSKVPSNSTIILFYSTLLYSTLLHFHSSNLKIQLAKLDSEAWPGVLDSEQDRLMLINEKEELLKEMRFISPRKWTQTDIEKLEMKRKRLEEDLQTARDTQSKALTERYGNHLILEYLVYCYDGSETLPWSVKEKKEKKS
uniref:WWC1-like helical hairpin domain-containing protein n=1 Tax=Laticauda laticaudata TaxID=8630 RepID=A0A8C5SKG7_LATLA